MTIANAFALYFCIGTIYAAYIIYQMHRVNKNLEETPIEDEEDLRSREKLIRSWEAVVLITKTTQKAIVAMFILITLFWPYVTYSEIRSYFRKDEEA